MDFTLRSWLAAAVRLDHITIEPSTKPIGVKKGSGDSGRVRLKSQHPAKASRCLFFFLGCVFSSGSFRVECQPSRLNNEASQWRSRSLAGFPSWWGQMLACFRHPLLHHLQPRLQNIAFSVHSKLLEIPRSRNPTSQNFIKVVVDFHLFELGLKVACNPLDLHNFYWDTVMHIRIYQE